MKITLKEFLTQGKLGGLHVGLQRMEVIELIGEPEDWSSNKPKLRAQLWKYGLLEMGLDKRTGNVMNLGFEFWKPSEKLPVQFEVDGYFPSNETTQEEFEDYLKLEDISYFIYESLTFDDQLCLAIGSKAKISATIVFTLETNRIHSIYCSTYRAEV